MANSMISSRASGDPTRKATKASVHSHINGAKPFLRKSCLTERFLPLRPEDRATFVQMHNKNLAEAALSLTGNASVALACLYHSLDPKELAAITIPEARDMEPNVRKILANYDEFIAILTHCPKEDLAETLVKVLRMPEQFLVRVLDMWSGLEISKQMTLIDLDTRQPLNQKELAERLLYVYSPFVSGLGYHLLDMEICDTAFSILEPEKYRRIREYLFSSMKKERLDAANDSEVDPAVLRNDMAAGIKQFKMLMRYLQKELCSFIESLGVEAFVSARVKGIYSIYNKFKKYGLSFDKGIKEMPWFGDLIAARVVLTGDSNRPDDAVAFAELLMNDSWFFKLTSDENLIGGNYKNYYENPKANNYRSVHLVGDIEWLVEYCGLKCNGTLPRYFEVQVMDHDTYRYYEFGGASHAKMKAAAMDRTFYQTLINIIMARQARDEITRRISIEIIEVTRKGNQIRKKPPFIKCTFTRPYLEEKIKLSLRELYDTPFTNVRITDFEIAGEVYSAFGKSASAVVRVFVRYNQAKQKLAVTKVEIKPQK